jgi:hypothetical protein
MNQYQIEKNGITKSLLSAYLQCPVRFKLLTNGYSWKPSVSMMLGTYGHKMIETKRKTGKLICPPVKEGKSLEMLIQPILRVLIPAYFQFWSKEEKANHQPEVLFDTVRLGEIRLRGKIDDIINVHTILDTKFKGRIDEEDIDDLLPLSMDGLFLCYATGKHKFIYDVVRYPQIKERRLPNMEKFVKEVNGSPKDYFKRWEYIFDDQDLELFETELDEHYQRIKTRKRFTRNLSACWNCDFVKYCSKGDKSCLHKSKLFNELEV